MCFFKIVLKKEAVTQTLLNCIRKITAVKAWEDKAERTASGQDALFLKRM